MTASIKSFEFPMKKITVTLAAEDIKQGSLCMWPLRGDQHTPIDGAGYPVVPEDFVLLGDLALDGTSQPIHGALPKALDERLNKRPLWPTGAGKVITWSQTLKAIGCKFGRYVDFLISFLKFQ